MDTDTHLAAGPGPRRTLTDKLVSAKKRVHRPTGFFAETISFIVYEQSTGMVAHYSAFFLTMSGLNYSILGRRIAK